VKKLFAMLVTVCMAVSLLACSGAAAMGAAKKSGKITIWAWDPNFNIAVMKEAKARYQKNNPNVQIEIVEMAKADVEQKLHTVLASGVKEGLPDIVLIEDYNAQKYLQAYPGAFDDLTKKINHKNFASYKNKLMTVNGKIYGVPFDSGVSALFYRTDYLAKAGYKPSDLNNLTWDKFIEIGKKVKAATGKDAYTFDPADGGLIRIMLQSAGLWYFDKNGKPYIANNPALKEAFATYKKLMESGMIKKTTGWNEWVSAFNKGEAASIITGCWIIGSIKAEKSQSGKWAALPTPRMNLKASVNYSNLGGSSWYITQGSSNKAVAEDFLKSTFAADKDFYQKILVGQGAIGTYLPAQNGPSYTVADEFFGGQKVFSDFSAWMKKIPGINYGVYTYEADTALMTVMPEYLAGKLTVEAALKKAEDQLKNQINL
jgi:lactose/L-arabinose transport system substrate-binding protein